MSYIFSLVNENLNQKGKCYFGDCKFSMEQGRVLLEFKKKKLPPKDLLEGIPKKYSSFLDEIKIDYNEILPSGVKIDGINDDYIKASCDKGDLYELINFLFSIQKIYEENTLHITRMFGSYSLLIMKNLRLSSVYSTPPPIRHCPLMKKLLKEIGGETAEKLLDCLKFGNTTESQALISQLINDVVIDGGGFDVNRPLNTCERNVSFGASEIMSDAMEQKLIDASVIVSNNLGTIITHSPETTQGVVKRMSGLFHTSPNRVIMENAFYEGIIPVHPFTADIDQPAGIKKCIDLGYKKMSVSIAAKDNKCLDKISELESDEIKIYKFALCATGVDEETADKMGQYADIVWSCASKPVRERIAPKALAQVGIKIPIYIMSLRAFELIKPRLKAIDKEFSPDTVNLSIGENMPILFNENNKLNLIRYKNLNHKCIDCPSPCI